MSKSKPTPAQRSRKKDGEAAAASLNVRNNDEEIRDATSVLCLAGKGGSLPSKTSDSFGTDNSGRAQF